MGQSKGTGQGQRGAWRESPQEGYKVSKAHPCKTTLVPAPTGNSNLTTLISLQADRGPHQSQERDAGTLRL